MAANTPEKTMIAEIAELYAQRNRFEEAERELAEFRTEADKRIREAEQGRADARRSRREWEVRAAEAEKRAQDAEAHSAEVESANARLRGKVSRLERRVAKLETEAGRPTEIEEPELGTELPFGWRLYAFRPGEGEEPPMYAAEKVIAGSRASLTAHTFDGLLDRVARDAETRAARKPEGAVAAPPAPEEEEGVIRA